MTTHCIVDAEKDADMKSLSQEEAIAILNDMKIEFPVPKAAVTQRKRNVALDMAISAMSCSEIPNSSDCISRQEAIDALKQQAETMSEWSTRYAEQRKGVLTAVNIVEDLPPAEPANTSEIPNSSDTISRAKAIEAVNSLTYPSSLVDVKRKLADLPPAEPVIVPCNYVKACNEATMDKLTSAVLYLNVLEELKKHGYVLVDMREVER